jgi:hypothetical protein
LTSNCAVAKRRTRRSVNQHQIEVKDVRDEEIICHFNSQRMIVNIEEREIHSVKCFSCDSE